MNAMHTTVRLALASAIAFSMLVVAGCGGNGTPPANNSADNGAPKAGTTTTATNTGSSAPFTSAPIVFEPKEVQFGIVKEGELHSMPVKLRNTSGRPVTLLGSAASCGCTTISDLKGVVIPAGAAHEIEASMKIKSGLGEKHEQVKIVAQGWNKAMMLDLRAVASLPIRAQPPHLTATNGQLEGVVTVTSLDGKPFSIIAADRQPPVFANFNPATDAPRNSYVLKWNLRGYTKANMPWWWVIETDRPGTPVVDVRIRHEGTLPMKPQRGYVLKDQRMLVNDVRLGEPFEFETWLEYNDKVAVKPGPPTFTSSSPAVRVEVIDTRVDGQEIHMTVRATVVAGVPGLLYETLTMTHDGQSFPFRLIGRIVQ